MTVTAGAVTREFPGGNSTFFHSAGLAFTSYTFREGSAYAGAVTREEYYDFSMVVNGVDPGENSTTCVKPQWHLKVNKPSLSC